MAYALAQCFHKDASPHIIDMADRCACFNALNLAVEMLRTLPNAEEEIGLLLSRYCDESKVNEIFSKHRMRSLSDWSARAKEEEAIGSDAESVLSYVISQNYIRAVQVGMGVLKRFVREALELSASTKKLLRNLKYVKAAQLDDSLRSQFLLTMLWFTAHEAAATGLWDTGCCMLANLLTFYSLAPFVLNESTVKYQLLFFTICSGSSDALDLMNAALKTGGEQKSNDSNNNLLADLRLLSELLKGATPKPISQQGAVLVSSAFKQKSSPAQMSEGVWGEHTHSIMK